jgi:hypothetical protein
MLAEEVAVTPEGRTTMLMFAVIMTRRDDLSEGVANLSDDFHEAAGMGRVVLDSSQNSYIRAWVRTVFVSRKQAAEFWAKQGLADGRQNMRCPLVPKRFVFTYSRHFDAGRDEAAQG